MTKVIQQPPQTVAERGRTPQMPPAPPSDPLNATVLFQVIQQKPGLTRYMIVDTQSKTVSILKMRLPETDNDTAQIELESSARYIEGGSPR